MFDLQTIQDMNTRQAIKALLLSAEDIGDAETVRVCKTALEKGPTSPAWLKAQQLVDADFYGDSDSGIPETLTRGNREDDDASLN